MNINDYLWALNTKIKILIGVQNTINSNYDDIIWFNQGIFVLTTFNVSYSVNNYIINISGQDKMCLLNGTVGGVLPASIDFKQTVFSNKTYEKVDFGLQYIPGEFYYAKEYLFQYDTRETFTENEIYFTKYYEDFYPVSFLTQEEFDENEDNLYIIKSKESLYIPCGSDDWDQENNCPKIAIYKREGITKNELILQKEQKINELKQTLYYESLESQEDKNDYILENISYYNYLIENFDSMTQEERFKEDLISYTRVINTNDIKINDLSNYYKYCKYIPLLDNEFNDFQRYYQKDDKGIFKEVFLDKTTFNEEEIYYIDDSYQIYDESYNPELQYYKKEPGQFILTTVSENNYIPNTYFILYVLNFELSLDKFNIDLYYFRQLPAGSSNNTKYIDKKQNKYELINFLEEAEKNYEIGEYYLYQLNEFVLANEEYDPSLEYYKVNEFNTLEDIPIKTIIKEAIHTYGQEPYHNIIINDLDDYGLLLKEYRGEQPLYLLINDGICENFITSGDQECFLVDPSLNSETLQIYQSLFKDELLRLQNKYQNNYIYFEYEEDYNKLFDVFKSLVAVNPKKDGTAITIGDSEYINYDTYIDEFNIAPSRIFFKSNNREEIKIYTVLRLEYGDAAGYEQQDLTYPKGEDLISSIGDPLTSILDKICEKLQDFEYFYDLDGRFVFQRKKIYFNKSWNNIITDIENNQTYVENAAYTSEVQYTFEDNDLIISIQNTPKLENLKNDYSVWGKRKTLSGTEVPIHARYAIDKKPYLYVTFPKTNFNYKENKDELVIKKEKGINFLVQEIYVNKDYTEEILGDNFYRGDDVSQEETYENYLKYKKRIQPIQYKNKNLQDETIYPGVIYEYIICDWREVIYQMALDYYKHNQENSFLARIAEYNTFNFQDYDSQGNSFIQLLYQNGGKLYPSGTTGYEQYYIDLYSFWRELYNPKATVEIGYTGGYYDKDGKWIEAIEDYSQFKCDYYLPEMEYDKYANKIKSVIKEYQAKIEKLKKIIEEYEKNSDYKEIQKRIEKLEEQKKMLEKEKNKLLKNYFVAEDLIVVNNDEYRNLSNQYMQLQEEKKDSLKDLEEEIITILQDQFGLY